MPLSVAVPVPSARIRLDYLDGLRGLAALYVVLYHVFLRSGEMSAAYKNAVAVFGYGHYAVTVFLVLSGYCLMLPVARTPDNRLQSGVAGFLRRRARRILWPYYAACMLSLVLLATIDANALASELSPANLLSHLFLVQNLSRDWMFGINGALWSIATEWQIYFLFALLFLPLFRRTNLLTVIVVSMALGMLPHYLLPPSRNFDQACPWYLIPFALGMAGAVVNFSRRWQGKRDLPWMVFSAVGAAAFVLLTVLVQPTDTWQPSLAKNYIPWSDVFLGAVVTCLLIGCTRSCIGRTGQRSAVVATPLVLRMLESRPVVILGAFSYSLYLIHTPLLGEIVWAIVYFHLGQIAQFFIMWFVGVPLAIGFSYLFHLAFERPFMPGHPRTERQMEQAAITSPAP